MHSAIVAMILASGRSWWEARYRDGKTIGEWETNRGLVKLPSPFGGGSSRWEEIPKVGMVGLRLLCPDGRCGELVQPEGRRFFQLKTGRVHVGINGAKSGRTVDAHVIGALTDDEGNALCYAWEPPKPEITEMRPVVDGHGRMERVVVWPAEPGQLVRFEDNVHDFRRYNVGAIAVEPQQMVV